MKPLLIVDGYNVIGAWALVEQKAWSLEESRRQLQLRLEEYAAFLGSEAVLVFDGTKSERLVRSREMEGDVQVIFTRHGETADQYIERLCDLQPRHREVRVVTNDSTEQMVVLGRGAARMAVRELLHEMGQARARQRAQLEKPPVKRDLLIGRLPKNQQAILEKMRRGE